MAAHQAVRCRAAILSSRYQHSMTRRTKGTQLCTGIEEGLNRRHLQGHGCCHAPPVSQPDPGDGVVSTELGGKRRCRRPACGCHRQQHPKPHLCTSHTQGDDATCKVAFCARCCLCNEPMTALHNGPISWAAADATNKLDTHCRRAGMSSRIHSIRVSAAAKHTSQCSGMVSVYIVIHSLFSSLPRR